MYRYSGAKSRYNILAYLYLRLKRGFQNSITLITLITSNIEESQFIIDIASVYPFTNIFYFKLVLSCSTATSRLRWYDIDSTSLLLRLTLWKLIVFGFSNAQSFVVSIWLLSTITPVQRRLLVSTLTTCENLLSTYCSA